MKRREEPQPLYIDPREFTVGQQDYKRVCAERNEARAEVERLRAQLAAVRGFATERQFPLTDERAPINVAPAVRSALHDYLMAQAPSGEGYSEFITRALMWRLWMDEHADGAE